MSEQSIPTRTDEQVEYRLIEGFPAYRVGDDGSVWSRLARGHSNLTATWSRLKPRVMDNECGHLAVDLRRVNRRHKLYVHRLVLEAFVGPCPEGMQCRHLDGNPANNRVPNLAWGTPLENAADKRRHGRQTCGQSHPGAKLNVEAVRWVREQARIGRPYSEIAASLSVSKSTIGDIVCGKKWRHVVD